MPNNNKAIRAQLENLRIALCPVSALKTNRLNARIHSDKQIHQIARSCNAFGFTKPVLVDRNNQIIAAHGWIEAAKLLGLEVIPTICIGHLSKAQVRAYVIADNKVVLAGLCRG
jgi:ParB-like chromosome segregation protein Spo0J